MCVSNWVFVRSLPFLFFWALCTVCFFSRALADHFIRGTVHGTRAVVVAMSIRTHFCVVQFYSQLGWPVIKSGKPIWDPDPHQGYVDAFLFSAIWHALGGKRGQERPGLGVAVTALAGGELTVGDEFWARHRENGCDLGRILGSPRCVQRQGVHTRISVAATGASSVSCRGALLVAQQRGTPCGEAGERRRRSLRMESGHPRVGPRATCGKLLERPRACTTVTDFGFDGRKDRAGILEEAVLQCFHEWRRTVKVDLVTKDTLPQFSLPLPPSLQYLSREVSNGNLRRAAGGLARCPPPQRRSRSPHRSFFCGRLGFR